MTERSETLGKVQVQRSVHFEADYSRLPSSVDIWKHRLRLFPLLRPRVIKCIYPAQGAHRRKST